jgi:class 3 adenylate cyclase
LSIADDVETGVDEVLKPNWSITEGTKVPETEDIVLRNGAVKLDATYVYADMADSTGLAQAYNQKIVAKTIRCYLHAATKILADRGAEIRSFDGDRVMGIFIGESKNTEAVRAALGISWAVEKVIKPRLKAKWDDFTWEMGHGVGIDTGDAMLVRGGVLRRN